VITKVGRRGRMNSIRPQCVRLVGLDAARGLYENGPEGGNATDVRPRRRRREPAIFLPRALIGEPDPAGNGPPKRRLLWRIGLGTGSIALALVQAERANLHRLLPDAYTYFAAAKRLNDHHLLYQLSPGDLPVLLHPPYWSVPLLSPPFMAVVWRPLALLSYEHAAYIWLALLVLAMGWAAYQIFVVSPLAVAVAAPGLGFLLGSGNVHGFLFAALVAAWLWRGRTWPAAVLGVLTAAKVMPVVMMPWLISERRPKPIAAFLAAAVICGLIGLVGAGLDATLQYPGIMLSSAPQPISLAYLSHIRWLSDALTVAGMAAALVLRGRASYQVAVLTLVLFNPSGIGFAGSSLLVLLALPRAARAVASVRNEDAPVRAMPERPERGNRPEMDPV
jgi:hypothetical protein